MTLLASGLPREAAAGDPAGPPPVPVVIVDPGHGGEDLGAVGPSGALEKNVALAVSREVGNGLRDIGIRVVYTRQDDRFVPLAERTAKATDEHGSFYLSIHANASRDPAARGLETYFLNVEASDQDALQVAITENQVFKQAQDPGASEMVGKILADLVVNDTIRNSRKFALALHRELSKLPGPSRGVKQAEFVVLSGVGMPSALIELGFLTNAEEEKLLTSRAHQKAIGLAVVRALGPLLRSPEIQRSSKDQQSASAPPVPAPAASDGALQASDKLGAETQP